MIIFLTQYIIFLELYIFFDLTLLSEKESG